MDASNAVHGRGACQQVAWREHVGVVEAERDVNDVDEVITQEFEPIDPVVWVGSNLRQDIVLVLLGYYFVVS